MQTTSIATAVRLALLLVGLSGPLAAATDGVRLLDVRGAERSMVVTLGTADSTQRTTTGAANAPVMVLMPSAQILTRFRGELVDAEGRRLSRQTEWSASFLGAGHDALARLSTSQSVVDLPRPYGLGVAAGDTLVVVANVPQGLNGAFLRLTIDFELADDQATRIPVRLLGAIEESDGFTWHPDASGRFVAITSVVFAGANELVLEDVESGAVLWRERALPREAGIIAMRRAVIFTGVAVERGRAYRLRLVGRSAEAVRSGNVDVAVAFLLPND